MPVVLDNFRLNQSAKNLPKLKGLICHYISKNKKYFNKEVISLPNYEKSAPFFIDTMRFADDILPDVQIVRKNLGFDEENLDRNNLVLEKIMLERIIRKQRQNDFTNEEIVD